MTDNSKKKTYDPAIWGLSDAFYQAMSELCAKSDWDNDVYNAGRPFTKNIEVRLTRAVMRSLGGICEVQSSADLHKYHASSDFKDAMHAAQRSVGTDPRLDGYWAKYDCFWEAKISKIDLVHGKNGGKTLYDIGQWSKDLTKLHEISKRIRTARLIYSICAVTQSETGILSQEAWVARLKAKIIAEMAGDLKRVSPELLERSDPRLYQRAMLLGLLSLDSSEFCTMPADRWAVISVDARAVSERIIHLGLP